MPRVFLIFVAALVALMAGALFYAARIPVQQELSTAAAEPLSLEAPRALEIVPHPTFNMPDLDGVARDLSEWQGKHRILNFWATWCGPCRREIPLLKAFQDEQSHNGFQVIGIAVDYTEEVVRYAEAAEFNYPVVIGEQEAIALAQSSGIYLSGLPFTMFIAADGEYIGAYIGELHQAHLDTVIDVMTRLDHAELNKDEARSALKAL